MARTRDAIAGVRAHAIADGVAIVAFARRYPSRSRANCIASAVDHATAVHADRVDARECGGTSRFCRAALAKLANALKPFVDIPCDAIAPRTIKVCTSAAIGALDTIAGVAAPTLGAAQPWFALGTLIARFTLGARLPPHADSAFTHQALGAVAEPVVASSAPFADPRNYHG